jgi:hypothetical protein
MYWKCNCGSKSCELGWKINSCEKKPSIWFLYQSGVLHDDEDYETNVQAPHQKPKQRYGIALDIQDIYNEWLNKDDLITAQFLRCKLITKRKENVERNEYNRKLKPHEKMKVNQRFVFSEYLLPTLKQVVIINSRGTVSVTSVNKRVCVYKNRERIDFFEKGIRKFSSVAFFTH